jgi:Plasmid encoded RepA protein
MGEVHNFIEAQGKQAALKFSDFERSVVEAAVAYMGDEDGGIGFLYAGWCQAALPHKKLADGKGWQIEGERITLIIEPGMRRGPHGEPVPVGVPYGSRARLILLYLQSEAMRTGSREVVLGKSLRNWLLRMGIPQGGNSILGVREQAERISRCRLTFHVSRAGRTGLVNQNIVDTAIFLENDGTTGQASLFVETAKLSEGFFEHLRKHPVPLEDAAIRALNNNSMALDIYAWLAYRLHALPSPRPITWKALKTQFGAGYGRQDNFIRKFLDSLRLALAVYPAARVDVNNPSLVLHPSRPPIAPKQLALR